MSTVQQGRLSPPNGHGARFPSTLSPPSYLPLPHLPFLLSWQCPLDALDTAALSGGPGVFPREIYLKFYFAVG